MWSQGMKATHESRCTKAGGHWVYHDGDESWSMPHVTGRCICMSQLLVDATYECADPGPHSGVALVQTSAGSEAGAHLACAFSG